MATGKYRNLNNQEYWIKRSEERTKKHWDKLENVEKELAKQYRIALDDIRSMVSDLYTKYATDNKLDYSEAVKRLNAVEISDYQTKLNRLITDIEATNNPALIAELNKLRNATELTRLKALVGQIDARLLELGYEEQMTMENWLAGVYETNYYETIFAVQTGTGLGTTFAKLNEDAIKNSIYFPWSNDQFSDRIWNNRTKLVQNLRQTITQGLIKGESVQDMARNLKRTMNSSYSNSLRLIRTETAHCITDSTFKGYTETGIVSQYIIIATLDKRTSSICREKDNKIYRLDQKEVSVTAPPFHPNCRTDIAPYFDDDNLDESFRTARGEDGRTYSVPASMSYKEWYEKHVAK